MNSITNKAIRYEIIESIASKYLPDGYIVGNINNQVKRSGRLNVTEKQINIIASVISQKILKQEGVK